MLSLTCHPRQVGVTLQGELFSAAWLARLARAAGLEAAVAEAGALLDTAWLLGLLASPGLVLVPYDCSATGAVCLERGHKGRLMKNVITTLNQYILRTSLNFFYRRFVLLLVLHGCPQGSLGCSDWVAAPYTLPAPGRHAPGRVRGPLPAGGRGGGGAAGGRARHRHGGQGAAGGQAEQVTGARDIRSVTFIIHNHYIITADVETCSRLKLVSSCRNLVEASEKRLDGSFLLPDAGIEQELANKIVCIKSIKN